MSLNIKNEDAHKLATALARLTGESKTKAVTTALRERLTREKRRRGRAGVADRLMALGQHCAERPVLDERSPDEILGYDERGLPS
ncbi:MAG: type II toxin-antitoxin system VapB family antitoxin [Alphaproteobacteria bacterium]|nr:type II toxin-antitoxin system VapB family antitoxin [Alphaproteobacteria bacterium]